MSHAYKNYFPLPNEIFSLNLSPGEIAVYSYLLTVKIAKRINAIPATKPLGRQLV